MTQKRGHAENLVWEIKEHWEKANSEKEETEILIAIPNSAVADIGNIRNILSVNGLTLTENPTQKNSGNSATKQYIVRRTQSSPSLPRR